MTSVVPSLLKWSPTLYYTSSLPLTILWPVAAKKIFKIRYKVEEEEKLNIQFYELFRSEKIKSNIISYPTERRPLVESIGSHISPLSIIVVNKRLLEIGGESVNFLYKKHIYFIHDCAHLFSSGLAAVAAAVSMLFLANLWGYLALINLIAPIFIGSKIYSLAGSFFEKKANDFALKHATDAELISMERLIRAQITVNKEMHKTYPRLFDADGNAVPLEGYPDQRALDTFYMTLLQKMTDRNINRKKILGDEENMEALENFHRDNYNNYNHLSVMNRFPSQLEDKST